MLAGARIPMGLERAGSRETGTSQVRKGGRTALEFYLDQGFVFHRRAGSVAGNAGQRKQARSEEGLD